LISAAFTAGFCLTGRRLGIYDAWRCAALSKEFMQPIRYARPGLHIRGGRKSRQPTGNVYIRLYRLGETPRVLGLRVKSIQDACKTAEPGAVHRQTRRRHSMARLATLARPSHVFGRQVFSVNLHFWNRL
jgi:hypothetical protein